MEATKHSFSAIQQEIAAMLDVPDEELTDGQKIAMDAYLNELASMEADKVDAFGQFVRVQAAIADACRKESQRLAVRARTAENRLENMKGHYMFVMRQNGLKKVSGSVYTLQTRESKSVVVPDDVTMLPVEYQRIKAEANKEAIKRALTSGIVVPGCQIVVKESLQIK
ncbi:MAG: siphovirus Gp157 family protein [Desulfovibrio sp.]|jgi:hypothetical protein|nr:siphovirus Gp157 family protein [Desulfovibrio sp.]